MTKKKSLNQKLTALRDSRTLYARANDVCDPDFLQNSFFDAHDRLQVKYEMLRRVSHEGASVRAAAAAFGMSRPAFYEAQRAFQQDGLAGLIPERPGPRRAHKLSTEVVEYAEEMLAQEEVPTLSVVLSAIQEHFGIQVHRRSLERALARRSKKVR